MFLKGYLFFWILNCGCRNILANDSKPPNIVIILADDLGFDDVSFRGSDQHLTPNIDALAFNGQIINNMYSQAMCTPSRAALLTGLSPIHTCTQHFVLLNEEPWGVLENLTTMGEIFKAAQNYSTNLIGKWHLGMSRKKYTPNENGFDYFYGYLGGFIGYYDKRSRMPCTPEDSYLTDLLTEEAVKVIANHNAEQPLFLMVSHLAPHTGNNEQSLAAPEEEIKKFQHISDENKRIFAAMVSKLDESVGHIFEALDKKGLLKNSIIAFSSDNGAPTEGLFSNGGSNWPFRGQKNSPWEGALRVPAVIWSPLIKKKPSLYKPVMHLSDLLPTFAAAADIPLNSFNLKLDGINHWPYLKASSSMNSSSFLNQEREIVHVLDEIEGVKSFMLGRFKYIKGTTINGNFDHLLSIRNPKEIDPRFRDYEQIVQNSLVSQIIAKYVKEPLSTEQIKNQRLQAEIKCGNNSKTPCHPLKEECLYDIQQDPCETNNLALNRESKEILDKIKKRLEELQATALEPCTGGSIPESDPSRHDCIWTYYMEKPMTDYILECDYDSPPCQSSL